MTKPGESWRGHTVVALKIFCLPPLIHLQPPPAHPTVPLLPNPPEQPRPQFSTQVGDALKAWSSSLHKPSLDRSAILASWPGPGPVSHNTLDPLCPLVNFCLPRSCPLGNCPLIAPTFETQPACSLSSPASVARIGNGGNSWHVSLLGLELLKGRDPTMPRSSAVKHLAPRTER